MKRRTAIGAAAALALGYAAFAAAPSALADANVLVRGAASGLCLTPSSTSATVQPCENQHWSTTRKGEITIGGRCLDAKGQQTGNGTVVLTYACHGGSNQRWTIRRDGSIRGRQSGRCLDVSAAATEPGAKVQLWDCHGGGNQKWSLVGGSGGGTPSGSPTGSPSGSPGPQPPVEPPPPAGPETIGDGTIAAPARGPAPTVRTDGAPFTLVKNWNFGADGTIRNQSDMNREFQYHDAWGTIANGTNYGAVTVAPDPATAVKDQPTEQGIGRRVRSFEPSSLKTYVVPLGGNTTITPAKHDAGNGSFTAKYHLPTGGSRLGKDIVWETRVRYVSMPYHWFALWNAGTGWDKGAEFDVVESFGFDNGGGNTNYRGECWHSDPVGGTSTVDYGSWCDTMREQGVRMPYVASEYHTWSMIYRTDDTFAFYVDGVLTQQGTMPWTFGAHGGDPTTDFWFLFDAGFGHTQVGSVNHSLEVSKLAGTYYEFDWSRVYLRCPSSLGAEALKRCQERN